MTPFECGQRHAELFIGFSYFLREQAERQELEKLYFCTREGVFFKRVFEGLFQHDAWSNFEIELLPVSRKSVFPASILGDNGPDFTHLFRLYKTHSPRTIIGSLSLDSVSFRSYFEKAGLRFNQFVQTTKDKATLQSVLRDRDFVSEVSSELQHQRARVTDYFDERFSPHQRIGLVDIGWRATVMAALGRLYPEKSLTGLFLGLAADRNTFGPNCTKVAYGPDFGESKDYVRLLHAVDVPEFICLSDTPTTIGYRLAESGSAIPVPGEELDTSASISSFSIPFQDGVIDIATKTTPDSIKQDHQSGALRKRAMTHWKSLLRRPPQDLVDAYFSLRSDEGFGLAENRDQSSVPGTSEVLLSIFSTEKRRRLKRFLIYNQWVEGMCRRKDLGVIHRWSLFCLMKTAEIYKLLTQ